MVGGLTDSGRLFAHETRHFCTRHYYRCTWHYFNCTL